MNGYPRYKDEGIEDLSILPAVVKKPEIGQHTPRFFLMTEKGRPGRYEVTGASALLRLGADSFNPKSKFFNHQTVFSNGAMSKQSVVIDKIDMGGKRATIHVYLDVLNTKADIKNRFIDGQIDPDSDAILTDKDVRKFRIVYSTNPNLHNAKGTMKENDVNSRLIKIISAEGEVGAHYNKLGFNFKTSKNQNDFKALKYTFRLLKNDNVLKTIKTLLSSETIDVTLLTHIDPSINESVAFNDVYENDYYNETDYEVAMAFKDISISVHEDNVRRVAEDFAGIENALRAEAVFADADGVPYDTSDWYGNFDGVDAKTVSILDGKYPTNVPMLGVTFDSGVDMDADFVNPEPTHFANTNTNIFLEGGTDFSEEILNGTETIEERYNREVLGLLANYLDPEAEEQEVALHNESSLWDSGFDVTVKNALSNIIAIRPDTTIFQSTYICNPTFDNIMSSEEQLAVGKIISSRLRLTPESTYFGTDVARAVVCFGSCTIKDSSFKGRIPTTYDLLLKVCDYMGAGNGKWKHTAQFDAGDESAATSIENILPKNPKGKAILWRLGINWLEPLYTKYTYHWPAFATVASDRSKLNSIFTMMAAAHIARLEIFSQKKFSGENRYSAPVFLTMVKNYMEEQMVGKFDDRFLLSPIPTITTADAKLGYQYALNTRIGANNMFTVVRNSRTVVSKEDF